MAEYLHITDSDDYISIAFYIEHDNIMKIGDKLNEINEEAYMNGYNWEALLNCYLEKNAPELLVGLSTDPEAGMYAAYYNDINKENREKIGKLAEIIEALIENEDKLYKFVKDYGDEIEWD